MTTIAWELETPRLRFRPWRGDDASLVRASLDRSANLLRPWVPFMRNEPRDLDATRAWLEQRREWFCADKNLCYAMFTLEDNTLVGEMTLMNSPFPGEFEFGYWVDVEHTGRGYATEGSAALIRWVFEGLSGALIEAKVASPNAASIAVPKRLGFRHECTRARRYVDCEDVRHDMETFVLFADDYPGSPAVEFALTARDAEGTTLLDQK